MNTYEHHQNQSLDHILEHLFFEKMQALPAIYIKNWNFRRFHDFLSDLAICFAVNDVIRWV